MVKSNKAPKEITPVNEHDESLGGGMIDQTQELLELRSKVAQLEQEKRDAEKAADLSEGSYVKEMEGLRKAKAQGLNEIKVKEIAPKTVSLWHVSGHNVGKRVGPIDANNAEETFLRFAFFKIRLSLTRPTEQWIANYKNTDEYKIAEKLEIDRRNRKKGTTKESEVEKLTKLMAKKWGMDIKDINGILPQEAVAGLRA